MEIASFKEQEGGLRMSSASPSNDESSLNFLPIKTHTFAMANGVSLRVYSDTRPHNWKIADLQKGLVLVGNGREMVGEGAGFGLPVLVCSDETYFSGTSKTSLSHHDRFWIIRKEFVMDRTARNRFRNVTLENRRVRDFFGYLASLYQRHPQLRFLELKKLTGQMNIDTAFVETIPYGRAIVTYLVDKNRIKVKVDFRHLKSQGIRKIFMLNEQGSRFFTEYVDSEETKLNDERIGAWDEIDAAWASLIAPRNGFGFRLWRLKNCVLRRGREFLKNSLDWVGLDYEVNGDSDVFEYTIEIIGA
jgi:hypothetical protein